MDVISVLGKMTLEEKIQYVAGTDFMYTKGIPRLGVPPLCMADGPHGLRKQVDNKDFGMSESEPATAFPTAATVASSWNVENAYRVGEAIAQECSAYGVNLLLGPGVNIKRNPLCGRNFEYFSEDPLLAGEMGAAQVQGIQSQGVGSCVKHYALNNSENYRFMGNSIADRRTINEIYLKAFEKTVRQGCPAAIMSAYNKVNGTYCSQNRWLLRDVLKGQWGFTGLTMTDWGGMHDRRAALEAGLDLEMPGDTAICQKWIADGLADGSLSIDNLDNAVLDILEMVDKLVDGERREECAYGEFDRAGHDELAAEVALDSAVLLKNKGILPLTRTGRYVVMGDLFEKMRYQGAGSSMINPTSVTSPKDAFDRLGVMYEYARGYAESEMAVQPALVAEARQRMEQTESDAVLVFAGLTDYAESEGADRETMSLPENQLALIDVAAKSERPVVVVLFGGSPLEVPFADDVDAILYMVLPGQKGGTACGKLLFGDACPSGHLAETWPLRYEDVPLHDRFGRGKQELYKEGLMVGYRGYCSAGREVRYPFGFGLSYTSFDWRNLNVSIDASAHDKVTVDCEVENTGSCSGATTLQLYVAAPKTLVEKPSHELRAFSKVYLAPAQTERVTMQVPIDELLFYDSINGEWVLEAGEYEFRLCSDAQTVVLSQTVTLEGTKVEERRPATYTSLSDEQFVNLCGCPEALQSDGEALTVESRITELGTTFIGRILLNALLGVTNRQMKRAAKMQEGTQHDNAKKAAMFMRRGIESNSLICMSMCAGKMFPYNFAEGFAHIANGRVLRGIKSFVSRIRVVIPDERAITLSKRH